MIGHLHYIMSSKYELFLFSLLSVALVIINHHGLSYSNLNPNLFFVIKGLVFLNLKDNLFFIFKGLVFANLNRDLFFIFKGLVFAFLNHDLFLI